MKRAPLLIKWFLCAALLAGCGPTTFLIDKDGTFAYFGREKPYLHKTLCMREELKTILADAELPQEIQNDLQRAVCSDERSSDKVVSLYLFLTPEEKQKLKKAFEKHGYKVNQLSC